jgi:hypothetical protein
MNPDEVKITKITKKATREITLGDLSTLTMHYEVGFIPSKSYGFFEYYDEESGGEECYAEGGLWFDTEIDVDDDGQWVCNMKCVDYDGVFELSDVIIELCKEMNLDMSEIE